MTVYLIRHGQTQWNIQGRYLGITDIPLCDLGIESVHKVSPPETDLIFTSPLIRCLQTADIMFPNRPKEIIENLRECNFGNFEGLNAEETEIDDEYRRWVDSGCTAPIPGGETVDGFRNRVCSAFEEIILAHTNVQSIAFVVHGGVIMSLLHRFNTEYHSFYEYKIENCAVITCDCFLEGGISLEAKGGGFL